MMPGDGRKPGAPEPDVAAELESLAEDWITLWQSEIAGLAADREAAEGWAAMSAAWAGLGAAWLRAATAPPFGRGAPNPYAANPFATGPAHDGPAAPSRPAPAAASPDPGGEPGDGGAGGHGDAALRRRVDELERRLAALEPGTPDLPGGAGGDAPDRRRPRRRKPAG
jgi:hypothetical protein